MKVNSGVGGVFCSSLTFSRFFSRFLSAIVVAFSPQDNRCHHTVSISRANNRSRCTCHSQTEVLSIESVLQILSPSFGSFNSQGTTVIAEFFFHEIERHLLEQ